jgi:hypothetical protein
MPASSAASPALITPTGCLHSSDVQALDKVYALEQAVTDAIRAVGKSLILLGSEPKAITALINGIVPCDKRSILQKILLRSHCAHVNY